MAEAHVTFKEVLEMIDSMVRVNTDSNAALVWLYDAVEKAFTELKRLQTVEEVLTYELDMLREEVKRLRRIEAFSYHLVRDFQGRRADKVHKHLYRLQMLCRKPEDDEEMSKTQPILPPQEFAQDSGPVDPNAQTLIEALNVSPLDPFSGAPVAPEPDPIDPNKTQAPFKTE
jgi:hypothetical protein